jgi:hypothetical protein
MLRIIFDRITNKLKFFLILKKNYQIILCMKKIFLQEYKGIKNWPRSKSYRRFTYYLP